MRVIKYKIDMRLNLNDKHCVPVDTFLPYPEDNEGVIEQVKAVALNGKYTIEDMVIPERKPTVIDSIEAQATYTAMMTDTLLEV